MVRGQIFYIRGRRIFPAFENAISKENTLYRIGVQLGGGDLVLQLRFFMKTISISG